MITYDDQKLVSFLLDELSSSEREEIEQRIFADDAIFARVEDVETDLIDAYVRGDLAPDVQVRLERFLQSNPSAQEKVILARLLRDRLAAGNVVPFRQRYGFAIKGALAAILVVVVIGGPSMLKKAKARTPASPASLATVVEAPGSRADTSTDAISPDATATDSAGTTETPMVAVKRTTVPPPRIDRVPAPPVEAARAVTLVLSALTVRSGGMSELVLEDDVDLVTIHLPLERDEYQAYNVDVRNTSGRSVWTALRLPITTVEGGPAVSLDVPATAFAAGRHELVLAGVAGSGTEEIAYVEFDVRR